MDLTSNYTGPYLSDGKFQPSVPYGTATPTDHVDSESRLHDTAYAMYKDPLHRFQADSAYRLNLQNDPSLKAMVAGQAVTKGNILINGLERLGTNIATYGPLGLLVTAGQNILSANDILNDTKAAQDIRDIRNNDPNKSLQFNPHTGGFGFELTSNPTNRIPMSGTAGNQNAKPNIPSGPSDNDDAKPGGVGSINPTPESAPVTAYHPSEARDTYYLDIGGVRVNLTRKEYERQMKLAQPKRNKKKRKPKKLNNKAISNMVKRLSGGMKIHAL